MTKAELLDFSDRLNAIMPVIMREFVRKQENELYKGKITLPQFLILEFIGKEGHPMMTSLAHFMNVTTAAVTGIVDRLVKCGYVLRVLEPEDRRVIRIKLTAKGSELVKKIDQQRRQMIQNIFSKVSSQERRDYLNVLTHLHDILKTEKEALA